MLTLKQLEAFVWVADLGSFRRAADQLRTTQPNISARIAALESLLSVTLMQRDAGSVRLTARGQALLHHARTVLNDVETLQAAARDTTALESTIRLGVTELIVHTWLGAFLKAMTQNYPKVTVELTIERSAQLETELANRTLDIAFQNGPFSRPTQKSISLGVYPLIWVASPKLGLSQKTLSRQILAQYPILTHGRDTRFYMENAAHFEGVSPQARLVPSSNLAACIHMTLTGMGVAALPAAMIIDECALGQLERINYNWTPQALAFYARYNDTRAPDIIDGIAALAAKTAKNYAT
jgi:DNA-binding transcriptional LysR family regulator